MKPGSNKFGLQIAKKIIKTKENEGPELVHKLYKSRRLSTAIHEINNLQRDPEYRKIAEAAIKRIGFN